MILANSHRGRIKKIAGAKPSLEFAYYPGEALVNDGHFDKAEEVFIAERNNILTLTIMYGCNDADVLLKNIFPEKQT